jgi:hypothetical protein
MPEEYGHPARVATPIGEGAGSPRPLPHHRTCGSASGGEAPPNFRLKTELDENADAVAARFRRTLGISLDEQLGWHERYAGFNAWRDAIEEVGALVLQMTDVPVVEARGFSLAERPLPAAVANIKDSPRARSFTLIHELTHVALRESGVCTLDDAERVEVFCNRVAGSIGASATNTGRSTAKPRSGESTRSRSRGRSRAI